MITMWFVLTLNTSVEGYPILTDYALAVKKDVTFSYEEVASFVTQMEDLQANRVFDKYDVSIRKMAEIPF